MVKNKLKVKFLKDNDINKAGEITLINEDAVEMLQKADNNLIEILKEKEITDQIRAKAIEGTIERNDSYLRGYGIENKKDLTNEEKEKLLLIKNYLQNPELLSIVDEELDKKIVKENDSRKVIFLITNMRNVANLNKGSDNLIVNALSGTGKDHVVGAVFDLIPIEEKEELIRTTPKVLAYTRNRKRPVHDKEGHEINYKSPPPSWKKVTLRLEDVSENVVNDDSFKVIATANPNKINYSKTMIKQKVVEIEIEGKPSMILTMANGEIRDEQLRRFPMLFLNEGIDQTKEILKRQAELAKTGKAVEYDDDLIRALSYLQRVEVKIPYADMLVQVFEESTRNVIARTAFNRFLDYIKSSASLFQFQREKDEQGCIIAVKEDYENGALCLKKTTSNLLMIPLSKLDKAIYDFFKEHKESKLSIDDLLEFSEIQHLGKSDRWIRFRCDFLVSKGFLNRASESIQGSFKPVMKFSYNAVTELNLPSFEELTKNTSNTSNDTNTTYTTINSDSSNTQNKPVNEVFEVNETILSKHTFEQKPLLCALCSSPDAFISVKDKLYCTDCYGKVEA